MGAAVQIREVPPLSERISAALTGAIGSADVEKLIREAQDTASELGRTLGELDARALDPLTSAADVDEARRATEEQNFARRRLEAALDRLRGRLDEVRGQEATKAVSEHYEAAKAERDALAAEFKREYPKLAGKLADLLARIAASNETVAAANRRLGGQDWLAPVEKLTRNAGQTGVDTCQEMTREVRLPGFGDRDAAFWPPASR